MAKKKEMMFINVLAMILLIVGGINWGMVGFFNFDLVNYLLGSGFIADLIYGLVGISAVYKLYMWLI